MWHIRSLHQTEWHHFTRKPTNYRSAGGNGTQTKVKLKPYPCSKSRILRSSKTSSSCKVSPDSPLEKKETTDTHHNNLTLTSIRPCMLFRTKKILQQQTTTKWRIARNIPPKMSGWINILNNISHKIILWECWMFWCKYGWLVGASTPAHHMGLYQG